MMGACVPAGPRALLQSVMDEPRGRLEEAFLEGRFAVTTDITRPESSDSEVVRHKAEALRDWVDAVNLTDNTNASARMSSWAASLVVMGAGVEPVLSLQCRGRSRLALQADLLGAGAARIPNVLLLTGDEVGQADHQAPKAVVGPGSAQLVGMAAALRDEARLLSGNLMTTPPTWLVGVVENPFVPPTEFCVRRLSKKVAAGAEFVQTQLVFDLDLFEGFMEEVTAMGLTEHCAVLAGVGPIRSRRALENMRQRVAGVVVPDDVMRRLESQPDWRFEEEGIDLCAVTIERLRSIPGVAGVHVMADGFEEDVPELLGRAGLAPREGRGLAAHSLGPC